MVTSCKEINAWQEGCSDAVVCDPCDSANGEQRFIATAAQTLFTLTAFSYAPGTNSLRVHRNGLLVDPANVIELSTTTFFLQNETVLAGDVVVANACPGITAEVSVLVTDLATTEVVLIAGQLIVNFGAAVPVANGALYISGPGVDNGRLVLGTDYSADTVNNIITLTDSYPAGTILLLAYSDVGPTASHFVTALFDVALHGLGGEPGVAAFSAPIPDNSTIIRAYYEVITALTSAGASVLTWGILAADIDGLLAATAYDNAAFAVGYHDFLPDGSAALFTTKTTFASQLVVTIATAGLTAGKIRVWYEYVTSE